MHYEHPLEVPEQEGDGQDEAGDETLRLSSLLRAHGTAAWAAVTPGDVLAGLPPDDARALEERVQAVLDALAERAGGLSRALRHLAAERERIAALLEMTPDGYFVSDRLGVIREANPAGALLLGMEARLLVGKPLMNYVALADRHALRQHLVTLGHRPQVRHLAEFVRIAPRGGPEFDASLRCTAVRDAETDELTAVRWRLRDLTEHSRAEAERFRLVVDSLEDYAIFTLDSAGRVTHWNRGAERVLGYTEAEAVGMPFAVLFPPEEQKDGAAERELRQALETGSVREDRWHVRQGGERFFAQGVLARLPVSAVTARGFVMILRDVTDRKRMEDALRASAEALEEANRTLEARVVERTAALAAANESLHEEVDRRRRSEEARAELMRQVVSAQEEERRRISREIHDQMGQHLTGFALALRALEDAYSPDSAARPLLGKLRGVADELGRDLHRLAVGLRPTSLDDLGIVNALRAYIDEWSGRSGIRADFQPVGMGGDVRLPGAVETALYRITQESLNNIAKYSGARLVTVLLRREAAEQDGSPGQAVLIVEDDGSGFDADAATSSSEDVWAAAAPGRPRLGLLGMRERATLLGGTFAIESSPGGGGTTVFVRLPLGVSMNQPTEDDHE